MAPIIRTSTVRALVSLVRNPLDALPASIFTEPMVFARTAGEVQVWIADPVLVHEALIMNADALGKGDQVRRALGPALGKGLLTADGAHWKWQRQSVARAFRPSSIEDLQPAMISAAEHTCDRLLQQAPGTIDIQHEMMRTTFDIIVETMMSGGHGIDVGRVERSITDYLDPSGWNFALGVVGAPDWMPYPGRRKAMAAVAFLRSSLARVIEARRRGGEHRHDLVSMLLLAQDPETGRTMTDAEIADNLLTFITAGHETTALGLAWTFDLLSRHPQIERKVLDEIATVSQGRRITPEQLSLLAYTRQVFCEAMRLYPPAPIITRTTLKDIKLGDVLIPAGTVMFVPIYAVHRHSRIWPDAQAFNPDRFSPEASRQRHRFAYMPFGAGPRICIGSGFAIMEAVAILAVILQKVSLASATRQLPEPLMKVTLRPKRNLLMKLRAR